MARESTSAVPATPMKGRASRVTDRDVVRTSTHSEDEDSRATDEDLGYGDDLEESTPPTEAKAESREEGVLSAGSRGVARSLSRNLADELSALTTTGVKKRKKMNRRRRLSRLGRTCCASSRQWRHSSGEQVLARCFEKMQSSDWIRQFNPRQTRQATWGDLRDDDGVTFATIRQLTLKEWSPRKLELTSQVEEEASHGFGVKDISKGDSRSRDFSDNVFPREKVVYFQDSHMVTPLGNRARCLANDCDGSHAGRSAPRSSRGTRGRRSSNHRDDDSSDSDYDFWDQVDEDPREELVRQMDALLELASHIPLDRIKLFSGRRNKSDNSMQWLKTFAFEMKGRGRDRTTPEETRRKWKLLSQAFMTTLYAVQTVAGARYYAATLSARSTSATTESSQRVEKGQRDAKDHVEQFLLTCGDDRLMQDSSGELAQGGKRLIAEALLNSSGTKGTPTVAAMLEAEAKAGRTRPIERRERREHDRLREILNVHRG
ncbi:hypothetical protein GQ600_16211 [Phytophthora cactorum]|nr:hypothetical protein GQ600_16211 [Phytophthora cactorum]